MPTSTATDRDSSTGSDDGRCRPTNATIARSPDVTPSQTTRNVPTAATATAVCRRNVRGAPTPATVRDPVTVSSSTRP